MFNEDSPLVKTWVRLITGNNPIYTVDQVPKIGNLREVVMSIVNKK